MSQLEEFKKLEELCKEVYLIADPGVIKLLCASIISHRLPADPTWCFLVGPSSGGKTEFINCLTKVEGVYPISSLTPHTLISGQKKPGRDTSLLTRIGNGIFTFKDFTTILTMNQDARGEIMGQLREVYDGKFTKEFGTGETKTWKGKISMFSGVTTVVYVARDLYAAMGERFAIYQLIQPDRIEVSKRAMHNVSTIREKREMLQDAFKHFLDEVVVIPKIMPEVTEDVQDELRKLAELVTRARSIIDREWKSSTKEITFAHDPEGPARFATQLTTYAGALMVLNEGPLEEQDKNILYKMALDSIDKRRRLVLQALVKYNEVKTDALAIQLNYPTNTIRRWCEDLNVLGLVDKTKEGNTFRWILRDEYKQLISKFEHIEMLNTSLEDSEETLTNIQEVFPDAEEVNHEYPN